MIDLDEIARLAELYDRYANALDRKSPDRALARRQFLARIESLYQQEGTAVSYEAFRFEIVKRCKAHLQKN